MLKHVNPFFYIDPFTLKTNPQNIMLYLCHVCRSCWTLSPPTTSALESTVDNSIWSMSMTSRLFIFIFHVLFCDDKNHKISKPCYTLAMEALQTPEGGIYNLGGLSPLYCTHYTWWIYKLINIVNFYLILRI